MRGPQRFLGYFGRPELDDEVFLPGGWLRTGDVASMDAEGYLKISGRSKEIIIVNAAIKGSKQPQQLMALNYLLVLGAEFDAVINLDGFNELALGMTDNARTGTALVFPRKWPLRVSSLDPEYRFQVGKIAYLGERRLGWSRLLESTFARHSPTAILLWRLSDKSLQRQITEAQVAMDNPFNFYIAANFE